jgi:hypothetical protein
VDGSSRKLRSLAEEHQVLVSADTTFQRKARVLQALWREARGLPIGDHRGRPLGSRIAMPMAQQQLLNFLTDTTRDVVRREVLDPVRSRGKLFGQPRIFDDLLSSQPMAFNLFGELQANLDLASSAFARLTNGRVGRVTAIEFEHAPGRGDLRFTADRSAFDVYVEFTGSAGTRGFIGIEVKYHEGLGDQPAPHRPRYDEVAGAMGSFRLDARTLLKEKPLQQIWRDHLLAGSLLLDRHSNFGEGLFVFLYPEQNDRCARAVALYRGCLTDASTFQAWTLESVVEVLRDLEAGAWLEAFADRYVGFSKIGV